MQHQLVPVHVAGWSCSQGMGGGCPFFPGGWGAARAGSGAAALRGGVEGRLRGVELLEGPAKIEMSMPLPHRCTGLG